jgi:16S rRNA A1518/A1519 N6-dimethyltransferase RsmA/KsgA/DIM1 with predicted DNA glycosylase/AP lyase activity
MANLHEYPQSGNLVEIGAGTGTSTLVLTEKCRNIIALEQPLQ